MFDALTAGILLGLAAGFSPGPLLVLVVSETLRHGVWAGLRVSLAPPITDLPIIIATLLLLDSLSGNIWFIGLISVAGGAFVLNMGIKSMRSRGVPMGGKVEVAHPLRNAVTVNALSPHPYLFWFTVGGPLVMKYSASGYVPPAAFIAGFYALLVGSKMAVAAIAGVSRGWLTGPAYVLTLRILGALLCLFSIVLFREGLVRLNLV